MSRLGFDTPGSGTLESGSAHFGPGMDGNLDALTRELTALTQRFVDLGAKLGDAARALEEAGAPPAAGLVTDLAGARSQFIQLRTDVLTAAQAVSVPPKGEPESLVELEPLLGAIEAAVRMKVQQAALAETRERVTATLERVLEIVHRDDPAFAALVGCHGKARALRDAVRLLTDPGTPEAQRVAATAQSFADLLTMVENRDALDDERYAQFEESVSKAFGRGLAGLPSERLVGHGPERHLGNRLPAGLVKNPRAFRFHRLLGGTLEVAGAGVVAEPLPKAENLPLRGLSQRR